LFLKTQVITLNGIMYYAYLDLVGIASPKLWGSRQFTWSNWV